MPDRNSPTSRFAVHRTVRALTAALSLAIFVLALSPLPVPPALPGTDKTYHLLAFAALVLPAALLHPRALAWVVPGAILQAGTIEIVQPYVNRFGEWADFVAGLKGVATGLALGLALRLTAREFGLFRL